MHAQPLSRRSALLVAGTLAAAAAAIVATLMIPPVVGLADNGDFERIELPAGLGSLERSPENRYFGWMQPRFAYVAPAADPSAFRTSEMILVKVAVAAGKALARGPHFDIRVLGAVHAAILLAALAMLVRAAGGLTAPAQAAAAALAVFFFTDPGYIAPLQSLYSQSASLLFLLLLAGIAALAIAGGGLGGLRLPAYFLCAALFVCSKPQESVQAVLLAPLGIRLAWRVSRRARLWAVLLAVALLALGWRYYRSAQNSSGWITRYNVVFLQLLPHSPDPAADLAELGLDPSLARFAGVSAWVPESPVHIPEVRAFVEGTSGKPSPRFFYLRHPARFAALLAEAAKASYTLQPEGLGNFAKESGAPPKARAFGPWGVLRVRLSGIPWLVAFFGGTLAAAAATYRRASPKGRLFRESLALLVLMASGAFLVTALGDTLGGEAGRHLYSFQAMCDLILAADLAWLVQTLATRRRRRGASADPVAITVGAREAGVAPSSGAESLPGPRRAPAATVVRWSPGALPPPSAPASRTL